MILKEGNTNKEVNKQYLDKIFARYPVKTRTLDENDVLIDILHEYLDNFLEKGDIVGIAESVISVMQKRAYKFSEIKYGFFAKLLSRFVTRTPAGIGLGTPQTMQLAINEVGLCRVLFAAFLSAVTRPFGLRGVFYRVAGARARGIDGPTENTIPPYNEYASLLPKNPNKVLRDLNMRFRDMEIRFCIVDANDLGVNMIGSYSKDFSLKMKSLFSDNPLGQGIESTPFLVCREIEKDV